MTQWRVAPLSRDALPIDQWPRSLKLPGLAHGWEGTAWLLLQHGDAAHPAAFRRVLRDRLHKNAPPNDYTSLYIGSAGRPLVAAMASREDPAVRRLVRPLIKRWCREVEGGRYLDVMLGTAGALLAATEIERIVPGQIPAAAIRSMSRRIHDVVRNQLTSIRRKERVCLGLAHGLAGYLLALEASQATFGRGLEPRLRGQLIDTFAAHCLEGPWSTAVWPNFTDEDIPIINGWCNGGPGIGLALLCGFALTGHSGYRELALPALEGAFRFSNALRTYCCGAVGRAQILVEGFRLTGDKRWLKKAREIATGLHASSDVRKGARRGFHFGRLGSWYLDQRIQTPSLPLPGIGPLSVPLSVRS